VDVVDTRDVIANEGHDAATPARMVIFNFLLGESERSQRFTEQRERNRQYFGTVASARVVRFDTSQIMAFSSRPRRTSGIVVRSEAMRRSFCDRGDKALTTAIYRKLSPIGLTTRQGGPI
jgi:ribosomal 50S subunit-associated protein YjgA (DUF615 family)